jgi:hypothetical protein
VKRYYAETVRFPVIPFFFSPVFPRRHSYRLVVQAIPAYHQAAFSRRMLRAVCPSHRTIDRQPAGNSFSPRGKAGDIIKVNLIKKINC